MAGEKTRPPNASVFDLILNCSVSYADSGAVRGRVMRPYSFLGKREAAIFISMGRILAIANQKGGVGKTTTAVNLSAALALAGQKVLLIDLDPQGNATSGLGINKNQIAHTLYDVLTEEVSLSEAVQATAVADLSVVPSNRQLVGAEVEFVSIEQREYRLKRVLGHVADSYNFIIIDCPPSLSLLTVNGLVAADGVLVTLQCEYYALEVLANCCRRSSWCGTI